MVSRFLDGFRSEGHLGEGVPMPNGGSLRVSFTTRELPPSMADGQLMDNRILALALDVKEKEPDHPAFFITKDVALRIRADALGLIAEDYDAERSEISELFTGHTELDASPEAVNNMYSKGAEVDVPAGAQLSPNEFVLLKDNTQPSHTAMSRFNAAKNKLVPLLRPSKDGVWGIRPRNREQSYTLDLLLNDDIKLVTLVGKAGTGKTLLAIAAGLQQGGTRRRCSTRSCSSARPDLSARARHRLPAGRPSRKSSTRGCSRSTTTWSFCSNLSQQGQKGRPVGYQDLVNMGFMAIEPLTYIRGRSIPNQFIIVDEAQNLTPHEVKTIVSRVGEGTKIILTGDPFQIDNPYVDSTNNGLVHVVNRFRGEKLAGHITLTKGERSALAEMATNLL